MIPPDSDISGTLVRIAAALERLAPTVAADSDPATDPDPQRVHECFPGGPECYTFHESFCERHGIRFNNRILQSLAVRRICHNRCFSVSQHVTVAFVIGFAFEIAVAVSDFVLRQGLSNGNRVRLAIDL